MKRAQPEQVLRERNPKVPTPTYPPKTQQKISTTGQLGNQHNVQDPTWRAAEGAGEVPTAGVGPGGSSLSAIKRHRLTKTKLISLSAHVGGHPRRSVRGRGEHHTTTHANTGQDHRLARLSTVFEEHLESPVLALSLSVTAVST